MKKFFNNLKLQPKLILSHLIVVLISVLIVTWLLNGQLREIIISNALNSERTLSVQTAGNVESVLSRITSVAGILTSNSYMKNIVSDVSGEAVRDSSYQSKQDFYESVLSLVDGELITSIRIFTGSQNKYLSFLNRKNYEVMMPMEEAYGTYWFGIFSSGGSSRSDNGASGRTPDSLLCPSLYLSPEELAREGDLAYITRLCYDAFPGMTAAYCVIYFSRDSLDEGLKQGAPLLNSASYIMNSRDAMVSTSDPSLSGAYFVSCDRLEEKFGEPGDFTLTSFLNEQVYTGYFLIDGSDWRMVSVIPRESLLIQVRRMISQYTGLYLLFMGLALVIALMLSHSIVKRVSALNSQMRAARDGIPKRLETTQYRDEIGELISSYNFMTDELNRTIQKRDEIAGELQMSEFRALQAQINPHFLYNSLDMIKWLSESGRKEDVTKAVLALAGFYKLTLSRKDNSATIRQELAHVSLYVDIQNMRYDNPITLLSDVQDEILDCRILKLILQPIVENSILHGILEKEEETGSILITGWRDGDDILLSVTDDGVGIPKEKLAGLLSEDRPAQPPKGHGSNIGIYNTHRRLEMLYGKGYGLMYRSAPGEGTTVEIRIPALFSDTAGDS